MVTLTQRRPSSPRLKSGWWWMALLTTFLFAFQVNYIRIHLLTELHHSGEFTAALPHLDDHHHGDQAENDHHHHHHHQPHSADDHELQLTSKRPLPISTFTLLLPETTLKLTPPARQRIVLLCKLCDIPGESPPDPRQPRAPPQA
jgi:hypothetical protein